MSNQVEMWDALESIDITDLDGLECLALPYEDKLRTAIDSYIKLLEKGVPLSFAYSGGKDSSVALDIGFRAILEFKAAGGEVPPFAVLHGNTLLENPEIDRYSKVELNKIMAWIRAHDLPGVVEVATPGMSQNHMVNLIGGRTIASLPGTDSKCSVDMKVTPITKLKKKIFKDLGKAGEPISIIGTRFDESDQRMKKMLSRNESHLEPVETNGQLVMSPIAMFTLDDIFWHIGITRNDESQQTFSDFEKLLEVYREGEGGECMVTAYQDGKARASGCGARFGCYMCQKTSTDMSMENMLKKPEFSYMQPLNDFRQWVRDTHFDPKRRNWLSRSIDENGMVKISPNAYSPQHSLEMLKIALTIQIREEERAYEAGELEPKFQILSHKDLLAIDILWGRYGYQDCLKACEVYRDIYHYGMRYEIPVVETVHTELPPYNEVLLPFADNDYSGMFNGLRDPMMAIIDQESLVEKNGFYYTDVPTNTSMGIDDEGAEMFFGFPELGLDYYLDKYSYNHPAAGVHALIRLGVFDIAKGGHSSLDRMLKMGNQISRHNVRECLNDPDELITRLLKSQNLTREAIVRTGKGNLYINDLFDLTAGDEQICEVTEKQLMVVNEISRIAESTDKSETKMFRILDNPRLKKGVFGHIASPEHDGWFVINPLGTLHALSGPQIKDLMACLRASDEIEVVSNFMMSKYQEKAQELCLS